MKCPSEANERLLMDVLDRYSYQTFQPMYREEQLEAFFISSTIEIDEV